MRSSVEEALSQLNKWKSESARIYISTTGVLTLWFVGKVMHVSSAALEFGIESIDGKDFLLDVNVHDARFEFRDVQLESFEAFFSPQRAIPSFSSMLEVRLSNGVRIIFAELV